MRHSEQLRTGRSLSGLTQMEAAKRLRVSQPYLSLLENGKRAVTKALYRRAAKLYSLSSALLTDGESSPSGPDPDKLVRQLAALGYPGYAHVRSNGSVDPATLLFTVLSADNVESRVVRALPWVLVRFPTLDWEELMARVKVRDLQNRLGFLVTLARELAERTSHPSAVEKLAYVERRLESSRLVAETTLSRDGMTEAERTWLRTNSSLEARHWNVLSDLTVEQVAAAL